MIRLIPKFDEINIRYIRETAEAAQNTPSKIIFANFDETDAEIHIFGTVFQEFRRIPEFSEFRQIP